MASKATYPVLGLTPGLASSEHAVEATCRCRLESLAAGRVLKTCGDRATPHAEAAEQQKPSASPRGTGLHGRPPPQGGQRLGLLPPGSPRAAPRAGSLPCGFGGSSSCLVWSPHSGQELEQHGTLLVLLEHSAELRLREATDPHRPQGRTWTL